MSDTKATLPKVPFKNQYMFGRVMCDEEICKEFLRRVLDIEIESIEYLNKEQVMQPSFDTKGSRLDVFVKTPQGHFDVEMQGFTYRDLSKRMRYYQAVMDVDALDKGSDYSELPLSYIIFVCDFDAYHKGLPVYTIERTCIEDTTLDLDEGSRWIVLNCEAASQINNFDLRSFMEYVYDGKINSEDKLVQLIDKTVISLNRDKEWVSAVLPDNWIELDRQNEARAQGRYEGRIEGRAEGLAEGEARFSMLVTNLFASKRLDDLQRALESEDDRKVLYAEFGL